MGWNKAEQRRGRAFVSSFALCSSAQQGGVSPGRPRYPSLGMWGWNEGGGGEKGVEVMPRHVYVSVWDEANASSLAQTELNSKIPSVASDFSLGSAFVFPNV